MRVHDRHRVGAPRHPQVGGLELVRRLVQRGLAEVALRVGGYPRAYQPDGDETHATPRCKAPATAQARGSASRAVRCSTSACQRVDAVDVEARCKADFRGLLGMSGAAPDLQELELTIDIHSPDSAEKVRGVYEAWLERCPVYLALAKPTAVKVQLSHRA